MLTRTCRSPKVVDGRVDQPLAALPVGDVVVVGHGLAAGGRDLVDHLLGRRAVVTGAVDGASQVVDHDLGPLGGEQQGVLAADAAARPR